MDLYTVFVESKMITPGDTYDSLLPSLKDVSIYFKPVSSVSELTLDNLYLLYLTRLPNDIPFMVMSFIDKHLKNKLMETDTCDICLIRRTIDKQNLKINSKFYNYLSEWCYRKK